MSYKSIDIPYLSEIFSKLFAFSTLFAPFDFFPEIYASLIPTFETKRSQIFRRQALVLFAASIKHVCLSVVSNVNF